MARERRERERERGTVKSSYRNYPFSFHQPVGTHIKDHLEFHNIYLGPDNEYRNRASLGRLTSTGFHSDVSYERQPPGVTILTLLSVPPTGGDTTWASQAAAYARLSEPIRALLEGLRAEHSGFEQAEQARRDGKFVRREPVRTQHPIVRVHPVSASPPPLLPSPHQRLFLYM